MTYVNGGATYKRYWWGMKTYMSQWESHKLQADLNAAGIIGGVVALKLLPIGVAAGYYLLLANRLGRATTSRGVILNQTWAGVFTCQSR